MKRVHSKGLRFGFFALVLVLSVIFYTRSLNTPKKEVAQPLPLVIEEEEPKVAQPKPAVVAKPKPKPKKPRRVKLKGIGPKERALYKAAMGADLHTMRALLSEGADPNAKPKGRDPIILTAALYGGAEAVEILLEAGANLTTHDARGTPLLVAATSYWGMQRFSREHLLSSAQTLLQRGLSPDARDKAYLGDGRNALHMASANGALPLVKLYLEHGADPNGMNSVGETPLHFAATHGHYPVTKVLLNKGADPDRKAKHTHFTPLMEAAERGFFSVAEILLRNHADPAHRNAFRRTALEIAQNKAKAKKGTEAARRYLRTVELLESYQSK